MLPREHGMGNFILLCIREPKDRWAAEAQQFARIDDLPALRWLVQELEKLGSGGVDLAGISSYVFLQIRTFMRSDAWQRSYRLTERSPNRRGYTLLHELEGRLAAVVLEGPMAGSEDAWDLRPGAQCWSHPNAVVGG